MKYICYFGVIMFGMLYLYPILDLPDILLHRTLQQVDRSVTLALCVAYFALARTFDKKAGGVE